MPLSNPQLDDEILTDLSVPIAGIDNSRPPSAIEKTAAEDAENRLAQLDGLNRPRPGMVRLATTGGGFDSIAHLGQGLFLLNYASNWFTYNNRSNVFGAVTGGPPYVVGTQVYSALANDTLYFSNGGGLSKYQPSTGFGTVTLPTQYPTALYPTWALNRLIYAYQNNLIVSDLLDPEHFDVITGSVTIDPITADGITGLVLWKNQQLAVFRNGSTWMVNTGPDLDVPDWQLQRVSGTIGCRSHGTIVQGGNDVFFLSETGRGVYALGQAPTSDEQGIWMPLSAPIRRYTDRINWAACDNARATFWNDLYILSVPLDGFSYNNFLLIYSVTLQQWQGLWCFNVIGTDAGARDFARDRTDINSTVLLFGTRDGQVCRFTYPVDRQYFDQNMDGSRDYYDSLIRSRSFTFSEDINKIRPHSVRFQFLESVDPVDVTVIANRAIELTRRQVDTTSYLLSLTIPGFPFDLDLDGYRTQILGLLGVGICDEVQFQLEATGNWTLFQIKATAFESMPEIAT